MRKFTPWLAALLAASLPLSLHAQLPGAAAAPDPASCDTKIGDVPQISLDGKAIDAAKSAADYAADMAFLNEWLREVDVAKRAGFRAEPTRQQRFEIGALKSCPECAPVQSQARRVLVGVGVPVDANIDLSSLSTSKSLTGDAANGAMAKTADGYAWTTTVSSPGAHAVRVVFDGLDLPENAALFVYNDNGEAFGPYGGRGIDGSGRLVSNTVTGDVATVQLRVEGKPTPQQLAQLKFAIAEIAHIGPRFTLAQRVNPKIAGDKAFCSYNASCVVNGDCFDSGDWAPIDDVRRAVAHMLFPVGSSYYICSGGLLNNTSGDGSPLFLTANHCIDTQSSASGMETFWDFREDCGQTGACSASYSQLRSQFPTVLGATLLATGSSSDFTLMELSSVPAGSRYYLGWTTTAIASSNNAALYRLSHPQGAPQSYSRHSVDANSFTCGGIPRGRYIYSDDVAGATEGGSSGSPVMNASGQVVGQLFGACGSNLNDTCDAVNNRTVDGAFANSYPSLAAYLDPGTGGGGDDELSVASVNVTVQTLWWFRRPRATVTVVDDGGAPAASATVSGTWSGAQSGSGSGTTNGSGQVTINGSYTTASGTFTFCVNNVSKAGYTFDGNVVCDSN